MGEPEAGIEIGLEVTLLAGEQIAALAGLGIGRVVQHGAQRIHHLIGVEYPALLGPFAARESEQRIGRQAQHRQDGNRTEKDCPIGTQKEPHAFAAGGQTRGQGCGSAGRVKKPGFL